MSKEQLDAYITMIEEAEKRDHRKIGQEMDLYHFQPEAQGSVFWHPKGFVIYNQMEAYIRRRLNAAGYKEIKTPQLLDNKLWEKSGHWGKFRENMFVVPDETPSTEGDQPIISADANLLALKPMNCPAHVQVFNQGIKSYRDLPLRLAEFGCCHRNEAHGALHGLMRVRQMTQDDAHIFCRVDQIQAETEKFCALLDSVYEDMGFTEVKILLATRPEVRAGEDSVWDLAEKSLGDALGATGRDFEIAEGEGAFYGPKLEFHLKDAIGRSWQCGTLQLDFVMPERLEASYVAEDGSRQRPVMLHRAVLGTLERFIGIMIENYAGPHAALARPSAGGGRDHRLGCRRLCPRCRRPVAGARHKGGTDTRNESINYKVREHSVGRVPSSSLRAAASRGKDRLDPAAGPQGQTVSALDEAIALVAADATAPDLKRKAGVRVSFRHQRLGCPDKPGNDGEIVLCARQGLAFRWGYHPQFSSSPRHHPVYPGDPAPRTLDDGPTNPPHSKLR